MSFFDLCAGLVLLVSVIVGWIRGGTREIAWVAAVVIAAIVALIALRFTGPIARHAIHIAVLANVAAVLVVFVAMFVLLSAAAAALTRRLHQTTVLGNLDRAAGAGFGLVRALVFLGLVVMAMGAVTPPDKMPTGAVLYPVTLASADVLRAFAPQGAHLAGQITPIVGNAIVSGGDDDNSAQGADQNLGYNAPGAARPGGESPR
jgi:membrane protein required for colicin V production